MTAVTVFNKLLVSFSHVWFLLSARDLALKLGRSGDYCNERALRERQIAAAVDGTAGSKLPKCNVPVSILLDRDLQNANTTRPLVGRSHFSQHSMTGVANEKHFHQRHVCT